MGTDNGLLDLGTPLVFVADPKFKLILEYRVPFELACVTPPFAWAVYRSLGCAALVSALAPLDNVPWLDPSPQWLPGNERKWCGRPKLKEMVPTALDDEMLMTTWLGIG